MPDSNSRIRHDRNEQFLSTTLGRPAPCSVLGSGKRFLRVWEESGITYGPRNSHVIDLIGTDARVLPLRRVGEYRHGCKSRFTRSYNYAGTRINTLSRISNRLSADGSFFHTRFIDKLSQNTKCRELYPETGKILETVATD